MALTIESTSSNTATNATTVVVTKPTGLAEGDLMVAHMYTYDSSNDENISPPVGWTSVHSNVGAGSRIAMTTAYKEADSSDVAASNFTFTASDNVNNIAAIIYRISGDWLIFDNDSNGGSGPYTISINPGSLTALLLVGLIAQTPSSEMTAFTISGTNPTWTEQLNTYDVNDYSFVSISANPTSLDEITSLTVTGDSNGMSFLAVAEVTNASVTTTLLEVNPTFLTPTSTNAASVSTDLLSINPTFQTPTASTNNPIWSNQSKSSTSWSNQTKS